jgi:hypothetical protein
MIADPDPVAWHTPPDALQPPALTEAPLVATFEQGTARRVPPRPSRNASQTVGTAATAVVATIVAGGVLLDSVRRNPGKVDRARHVFGVGPCDHCLSQPQVNEIERTAVLPVTAKTIVRFPKRLIELLDRAKAEGRDITKDVETFNAAWNDGSYKGGPCELTFVRQDWQYTNPVTGSVRKRPIPPGSSKVDPQTGDWLIPIAGAKDCFVHIQSIARIYNESGRVEGLDSLTGYTYTSVEMRGPA